MIWSIIQVFGKQGVSIIIFIVLAAILAPEDFGLIGMAFIWVTFLNSFSEAGFSSALIQSQKVTTKHFSSVFLLNVVVGIFLSGLGIALSCPAALLFSNPAVQPVMAVLSAGFFINSLSLTQIALAQKELRFKDLAIRDLIAAIIGGASGIAAALSGFGVWSLVIQVLVMNTVSTIVLWSIADWRPTFVSASFKYIKELWPYSSKLLAFNIVKFFAQNSDQFFISYLLGAYAMGIYTFSLKFTMIPITTFVGAIGIYLFPLFAKHQSSTNSIKSSYILTTKTTTAIIAPILLLVAILAPALVSFIWQDKWVDAIPIIQITALLAFVLSLISPVGQLLKALDRTSWLLYWSIYVTLAGFILLPAGTVMYNTTGTAWAITTVYIIGLPINYLLVKKLIGLTLKEASIMIKSSLLPALGMVTIMFSVLQWQIDNTLRISIAAFSGSLLYIVLLWIIDKSLIITLVGYVRSFFKTNSVT